MNCATISFLSDSPGPNPCITETLIVVATDSFASILLMNGESPAYVKEQLGHSSIKITVDVYGHVIPGANRQAVNRFPTRETIKDVAAVANQAI
jgi:hypothetical protein